MGVEELLKMLQDGGMDDDAIKKLLEDTLHTLDKDFYDADKKEEEAEDEDKEREAAGKLLGVTL